MHRIGSVLRSSLLAILALHGCDTVPMTDAGIDAGPPAAAPRVQYASDQLWDAPWPDERLRGADGTIDVSSFPSARRIGILDQTLAILEDAPGFGTSSTIYFPLEAAIDPASLPDIQESVLEDASVFLIDVDPESPERGARQPLQARFDVDPGRLGVPNLLALLPLQGRPLHPNRLYAAVVTTRVRAADGSPLLVAPATAALVSGDAPVGMSDAALAAHRAALDALGELEIDDASVAATAVFRTWDPTAELAAARAQVMEDAPPTPSAPFAAREVFDEFCVFSTTIRMPVFQGGEPPYTTEGGGWVRDEDGMLVRQSEAESTVWVTLPRQPMPAPAFPAAVFIRTGGGGDRPLVDRGVHAEAGAPAEPGTGPAMHLARAGFAGISIDGPLGGLRNLSDWDEQFAIFNINNPAALRDNIRQSALELILLAHIVPTLTIDASACPGLATAEVRLDGSRLAIMGHSMGATIAPLVAALEPAYRAMILSGAGASWIANVIFKESPLHVRPLAEGLLGYNAQGHTMTEHDPVLALLQWAGEPADPQVYARLVVNEPLGEPRQVLMFQGILDTYIPPPVANALSLALGVDLAGEARAERLPEFRPVAPLLPHAGRGLNELPVSGNLAAGAVTAVVVQHEEDGVEDGHEVVFQSAAPQLQYRCFLESLRDGVPRVPASDAASCD
jgi:fermentation-respiration switch protein FrsA (DUF1100 family)